MSLALLPMEWQRWLLHKLDHGSKPAELLRDLVQQGNVSLHNAMQAIDEVCGTRRQAAARDALTTAAPNVALPEIDVRRCSPPPDMPPVALRLALQSPCVAVLDGVLCHRDSTLLRSLAGAQPLWRAARALGGLPTEAGRALQGLQQRLAALLDRPATHFEPLQIRRWQAGDAARQPVAATATDAGQDKPAAGNAGRRVGCFVLTLAAPQRGGALCFAAAGGFLALPHAGGAVWVQHLRADGQQDTKAQHTQEPVQAGVLWQATLWLRERPWPAHAAAVP